ncbi:hypothetical protein PVL30_002323 [Lodderomyces elongisporus]|uniref:uncharacterized protein n=1 Tax=Lodderomyces elongisporus TaxID=36914 RepID=UPI00291F6010|nr:uncharacterized protein PVL30_002323 [Lodderomyces elongisporus]WLF78583.1 hypothetical protein PVL30_002323 [Lodderomyces elongisporus]
MDRIKICNDTVIKKKLNQHQQRCYGAYFTCIDCSTTFQGNDHNQHTSCISEAEKYEKGLYKGKKGENKKADTAKAKQAPKVEKKEESKKAAKKEPKEEPKEEPKAAPKAAPKENTKASAKASKSKSSSAADSLAPLVNKSQNFYKVLKKASKDDSKALKQLLKNLTVANVDGKLVIS